MGGGVNFFFFRFGSSGTKTVKTTSENDKGLSISFKIKTVDIGRQWMDTALLDYQTLTMADAKVAQWSNGVLEPTNLGSFTLLPTSMALASDITVTATEFSSETKDVFEKYSATAGAWVSNMTDEVIRFLTWGACNHHSYKCKLQLLISRSHHEWPSAVKALVG